MALIELFHVVADHHPVKAAEEITEGMMVALDTNGEVVRASGASAETALGIAGDTKSTSTAGLPTINDAVIGAEGSTTSQFQNRVSDTFDETKASGRMTVYHSGGRFATNQFVGTGFVPGNAIYVDSTGKLTKVASTSGQIIGTVTKAEGAFESGVPGTDVRGSLTLGSYLEFKLTI